MLAREFEAFYRDTVKTLVGFLVMQGASVADAADIAQETLSSAYQRWDSLTSPRAWSFQVASRALARRLYGGRNREDPTAAPIEPSPLLLASPADAWHIRHDLITTLAGLPARQRQVMAWTLSGYAPAEIADALNMTSDAVRSNLHLARRAFVAAFRGQEGTQ